MMIRGVVAAGVGGRCIAPAVLASGAFDVAQLLLGLVSASLAILAYGLTAVAIHRRFLTRRVPEEKTRTISGLAPFFFAVSGPAATNPRYMATPQSPGAVSLGLATIPFPPVG